MCRSIKPLFNYEPPATEAEIKEAAIQYVRKISGFRNPSKINEKAFNKSIEKISKASKTLIDKLTTTALPKTRK